MSFEIRTISNFDKEFKKLFKKFPSIKNDLSELMKACKLIPCKEIIWGKIAIK